MWEICGNVACAAACAGSAALTRLCPCSEKSDNIIHLIDNRRGNFLSPQRTIGKRGIDITRIGEQFAHAITHRRQLGNGQFGKCRLELAKAATTKISKHAVHVAVGKRGENADEILRLGPAFKARTF